MEAVMTTTINRMPTTAAVTLREEKAARTRRLLEGARVATTEHLELGGADRHGRGRRLLCRLAWRDGARRDLPRLPARVRGCYPGRCERVASTEGLHRVL